MSFSEKSKHQKKGNFLSSKKNIIISLAILAIVGFIVRINFVSFELPIILDGLVYFWYAIDMSQSGYFPNGYSNLSNNGWPAFLSIFFMTFSSSDFMELMGLQRTISIILSTITIIPVYFLTKRFVGNYFAIFADSLFIFDPRIIQNSTLGITEPLFLILLTSSIMFFLKKDFKSIYIAFALASLATIVRVEGIFLLLVLSIGIFWFYKDQKKEFVKYGICLAVVFLILTPMLIIRTETSGNDGIISRFVYSAETIDQNAVNREVEDRNQLVLLGFENYVKFLGWSLIPIFVIFVPIGFILILKNRQTDSNFVILTGFILSIPIVYGLSVASDTRFLFTLYPLFCILGAISLKTFFEWKNINQKIIIIIIIAVLITSLGFLEYKKTDFEHEKEALEISKIVFEKTNKINLYTPESKYLPINELLQLENFPVIRTEQGIPYQLVDYGIPILEDFETLNDGYEYFKDNKITHMVIDDKNNNKKLKDIFLNEIDYPYLTKIYDSNDDNFNYKLKIFEIDYQKWKQTIIKN